MIKGTVIYSFIDANFWTENKFSIVDHNCPVCEVRNRTHFKHPKWSAFGRTIHSRIEPKIIRCSKCGVEALVGGKE